MVGREEGRDLLWRCRCLDRASRLNFRRDKVSFDSLKEVEDKTEIVSATECCLLGEVEM